jgi:hypothetical protein
MMWPVALHGRGEAFAGKLRLPLSSRKQAKLARELPESCIHVKITNASPLRSITSKLLLSKAYPAREIEGSNLFSRQ